MCHGIGAIVSMILAIYPPGRHHLMQSPLIGAFQPAGPTDCISCLRWRILLRTDLSAWDDSDQARAAGGPLRFRLARSPSTSRPSSWRHLRPPRAPSPPLVPPSSSDARPRCRACRCRSRHTAPLDSFVPVVAGTSCLTIARALRGTPRNATHPRVLYRLLTLDRCFSQRADPLFMCYFLPCLCCAVAGVLSFL